MGASRVRRSECDGRKWEAAVHDLGSAVPKFAPFEPLASIFGSGLLRAMRGSMPPREAEWPDDELVGDNTHGRVRRCEAGRPGDVGGADCVGREQKGCPDYGG